MTTLLCHPNSTFNYVPANRTATDGVLARWKNDEAKPQAAPRSFFNDHQDLPALPVPANFAGVWAN